MPASGAGGEQLIVTATVGEGHYPPWAHNGLIDAFVAATQAIQQSTQVTYNRKSLPVALEVISSQEKKLLTYIHSEQLRYTGLYIPGTRDYRPIHST